MVHKWKTCVDVGNVSERFRLEIGEDISWIAHPLDILYLAEDVEHMIRIIKTILNTAFDFGLLKIRYNLK